MNILETLKHLGLHEHQGLIYLTLLSHGALKIADIAREAGVHRPTVYQTLPQLKALGLVTEIRKGQRLFFVAEAPEKLEHLLAETHHLLQTSLPELNEMHAARAQQRPMVKFLEGKKGIRFIFDDLVRTLKPRSVFYRYSSSTQTREAYLPKDYRLRRDQKKLERFVITNSIQARSKKPRMERAIKIVPKAYGLFDHDITQVIYGNNVAFIDYNSQTALLIENPILAKFHADLFRLLYDRL